jgi:peptide/nickel transport system substrate-binding protein
VAGKPARVILANGIDPTNLSSKLSGGGAFAGDYLLTVNSPLVILDPSGTPQPRLAAEVPARDRGSWVVNPDGSMATTWKLRPNALWHDGQPITSKDFVFAFAVYMDPDIDVPNRQPERLMNHIEPGDDQTFTVYWNRPYPWADELKSGQLEPLPEHLLGTLYGSANKKEVFANASFWSTPSYVGNGPYRLVEWDKGVQLTFRAFDHYFLGRPRLDEVVFRVITDPNAVAANVLAGAVDATVSFILNQEATLSVKGHWNQTGEGEVITYPVWSRYVYFQFDPAKLAQPALLDLRVRRAIVHATDRVSLGEAILGGPAIEEDVMSLPTDPLFPRIDQAITKYPFNRTRALALLGEAGWTRRGETLVNAAGQPLVVDFSAPQQGNQIREMAIVASDLRAIGMQVNEKPHSMAQARDNEFVASFPGLVNTATAIDVPLAMRRWTTEECPSAETRWLGSNRGCWSNGAFDRAFQIASTSLDEPERSNAIIQMSKILTEELPSYGTFYHLENVAVRKGLIGPAARWPAQSTHTWNIHDWRWA